MKLLFKLFIILLLFSFQFQAQNSQANIETEEFKKNLEELVVKKMKQYNVIGLNIAIEIENQLIVDKGFGFSDKSINKKTTNTSEYPIGSVSKIVTSTAVLKLHSDGLIDLDEPYIRYVPDFLINSRFDNKNPFTIRHLLSHYAGLPRLLGKGYMKKEPVPLEQILLDSKEEYLIAPPGKAYQYSDWGVDLLSLLVERVSGMSYEEYVEKSIFNPLKMNHSYFGPSNLAKGYVKGKEIETYRYSFSGSDGVVSTASDLLKLTQLYTAKGNVLGEQFLKEKIVDQALEKQFIDAPLAYDHDIGLMWEVRDLNNGNTRVKKAGIHEPFYTYIFFIPEYSASIVICSNSNSSSVIHWEIWAMLYSFLGKKYDFMDNQGSTKKRTGSKKSMLTNEEFKMVEGSYSTKMGILNFERNGKKFKVNLSLENQEGIGIPYEDGLIKLYVKKLGVKIHAMDIFWDDVNGEIIIGEQYATGERVVIGAKIEKRPIPANWKQAIGTYNVTNYNENDYKTFDTIKLSINSKGILEIMGKVEFPNTATFQLGLSPLSDEIAIIPGYNFDFFGGETVRLQKNDSIFTLKLSGYIFKKVE